MNITLTGSLGNISKPLAVELVQKGHAVTVISHNPEKQKDIEALGAKAAIGTIEDPDFLATAFTGADAVYCMISGSARTSNPDSDLFTHSSKVANNYKQAIQQSGVKHVVFLSSIGAHTDKGNGVLAFYYYVENILKELPSDVAITFMRPVGFYYNLLGFINTIRTQGVIASNEGGDDRKPWVSPVDIAAAIAQEITTPFTGRKARYVVSDELTCNEVAGILGAAIGKPDLKWIVIPDEQALNGLLAAGLNPRLAAGLMEMYASAHSGKLYEDYYRNRPAFGRVKMKDFAKEFALAYNR